MRESFIILSLYVQCGFYQYVRNTTMALEHAIPYNLHKRVCTWGKWHSQKLAQKQGYHFCVPFSTTKLGNFSKCSEKQTWNTARVRKHSSLKICFRLWKEMWTQLQSRCGSKFRSSHSPFFMILFILCIIYFMHLSHVLRQYIVSDVVYLFYG